MNAVTRWQLAVAEAESEIQALRDGGDVADTTDVVSDPNKFDDVVVPTEPEFYASTPSI